MHGLHCRLSASRSQPAAGALHGARGYLHALVRAEAPHRARAVRRKADRQVHHAWAGTLATMPSHVMDLQAPLLKCNFTRSGAP